MSNWITAAATVVMALTTIAYTWGTLRLWRTTRDALKLAAVEAFLGPIPPGAPFERRRWEERQALLVRVFPDLFQELARVAGPTRGAGARSSYAIERDIAQQSLDRPHLVCCP